MTLTLNLATDLEHQLLQEAHRRGLEPQSFILKVLRERLLAVGPLVWSNSSEKDLLEEINQGFPAAVWGRYRELLAKLEGETLGEEEHQELLGLIDQIEIANAHRIECLAELANRRRVPLETLMAELGIQPAVDA